jgi:two-component sensor histidine kinase
MDASIMAAAPNLGSRQSLALDFGASLLRSPSIEEIWKNAVTKIAEGTGAVRSRIMRYRAETDEMEVCASLGWGDGSVGSKLNVESTPAGRNFRTGMPILLDDVMADPRFSPDRLLHGHGAVSTLDVPIRDGLSVYGALEIESDARQGFSADDLAFLQEIALLTGLALMGNRAASDAVAAARVAAANAAERALVLRELRHRTANNLQTIMATLNIEMRATQDATARQALQRVIARVAGIGRAEASLAAAERGRSADLQIFLRGLCAAIAVPTGVRLETDLMPVHADRRAALPIGLVVNEAVTNCLKHAFAERRGVVTVALRPISESRARVSIRDDGVGLFEDWKPGSGTEIMNALAHNFGATIMRTAGPDGGTTVIMEFPCGAKRESERTAAPAVAVAREQVREGDE